MKHPLATLLVFSFALAPLAADKKKPAAAKWENPRKYKVVTPKNYDPKKKYPFILSLHGFTGNGAAQRLFFPLADLAEKHGFLYSYPSGLGRSWNATNACCDWANKHDDSAYLRGLILWEQKKYNIDPDRIGSLRPEDTWLRSWVHPHDLKEAVLSTPALDTNHLPPHQEVTLGLPHE